MSVDLSLFIPSFLEESFEELELMESSLLNLDQGDDETINSIFRAAHSIKGGADTFGFNNVTKFTHLVKTLLDEMRDGRRSIAQNDIELLLDSVDCMRLLIEAIRDEQECDNGKIDATAKLLSQALDENVAEITVTAEAKSTQADSSDNKSTWHIEFIPEHYLVQTGNDPIFLFSALAEFGELSIEANFKEVPALNNIDPEELYLRSKR